MCKTANRYSSYPSLASFFPPHFCDSVQQGWSAQEACKIGSLFRTTQIAVLVIHGRGLVQLIFNAVVGDTPVELFEILEEDLRRKQEHDGH